MVVGKVITGRRAQRADRRQRRGAVLAWTALASTGLLAITAMAVNLGQLYVLDNQLQSAADAAARGASERFFTPDGQIDADAAMAEATDRVQANLPNDPCSLGADGVRFGTMQDPTSPGTFVETTPDVADTIWIKVTKSGENGNPVNLFFGGILGKTTSNIINESAVSLRQPQEAKCLPIALRAPSFGAIHPDLPNGQSWNGPSRPLNGSAFLVEQSVTIFVFGAAPRTPLHLALAVPGADLVDVLSGSADLITLARNDEYEVVGSGIDSDAAGQALLERLNDTDESNDVVVMPIVEETSSARDVDGYLTGAVRVLDFVAVRLTGVEAKSVPNPEDPNLTLSVNVLRGTITRKLVTGKASHDNSGVVTGISAAVPVMAK